jgi:hypothetical protein
VTNLLTASAAYILIYLLFTLLFICQVVVFVILALVLAELAPRLVLPLLTTAPPHLATIVALMLSTTPIEVFFFIVLLTAGFTRFKSTVELSLPLDEFLDSEL